MCVSDSQKDARNAISAEISLKSIKWCENENQNQGYAHVCCLRCLSPVYTKRREMAHMSSLCCKSLGYKASNHTPSVIFQNQRCEFPMPRSTEKSYSSTRCCVCDSLPRLQKSDLPAIVGSAKEWSSFIMNIKDGVDQVTLVPYVSRGET